ncbi:MAG TPA: hypothetical protein VGV92_09450 [Gammaproteobacteria bacterium]|nr:hypothetical protein [Gammaproteobacteria bacterium]
MEEPTRARAVPYQRVYDRETLKQWLDIMRLEENQDTGVIVACLNNISKSRSPHNLQISLMPEENWGKGPRYIFNNPTFLIRQRDKDTIYQTIPGYIKIDFDDDGKLLAIELSNATLHDAFFNPAQMFTELTSGFEKPKHGANFAQLALGEKASIVGALKKFSTPVTAPKELAEFDKDRTRNIQTFIPFEKERAVVTYYRQALQSFLDTLLDGKLTNLSLESNATPKLYAANDNLKLRIEFTHMVISDATTHRKYQFPGKLILEYSFTPEKGFQFQFIASPNPALIGFFVAVSLAPGKTKDHLQDSVIKTFIHEPAKTLSTESELLSLVNPNNKELSAVLSDIKKPTTPKKESVMRKDMDRQLKVDRRIGEDDIAIIEKFYYQYLLAMPGYLCADGSTGKFTLVADNNTTQHLLMEQGKVILRVSHNNPQFTVINPYNPDDVDHQTFSGNITVEFVFNKNNQEPGFTFTGMTFSNNVLYNLIVNTRTLFPAEQQDENPALAKAFNATIKTLQERATHQENPQLSSAVTAKKK